MTVEEGVKAKLAFIAWRWRHLGFPGMATIMYAIKNRVPPDGNWLPVIEEVEQAWPTPKVRSDSRDPLLADVFEAVDWVYSGWKVDKWTAGGTHWRETGVEPPVNILVELAGKQRVANVGLLEIWK